MIPSLQPRRPQAAQPIAQPGPFTQTRSAHVHPQAQPPLSLPASSALATQTASSFNPTRPFPNPYPERLGSRPQSQMEAMPPFQSPHFVPAFRPPPPPPAFDPACMHPVFFTHTLVKPPFPLPGPPPGGGVFNPVALGYIAETNLLEKRREASGTKL